MTTFRKKNVSASETALITLGVTSKVRVTERRGGTLTPTAQGAVLPSVLWRLRCRLTQAWSGKTAVQWRPGDPSQQLTLCFHKYTSQRSQAATFSAAGSTWHVLAEPSASRGSSSQEGQVAHGGWTANVLYVCPIIWIPQESSGDHPNWLN